VVTATAGSLAPGNYNGQITISASNNGVVLQGSPQTITVTFTISGYTISGTALACGGPTPNCTTSSGLANATVTLLNNGVTVTTVKTDASGNFSFANVPLGSYTINVSGTSGSLTYIGTVTITVSGTPGNVTIQTFSS
jgi:hypothetical protein